MSNQPDRPAGSFGAWLAAMSRVLRSEQVADVPCDGCVGCCVSSYSIPLRPTDQAALAAVPARHLRMPVGGGVARMGYRDDGSCPMLDAGRCSIYSARPQTCRDYDCRIYTATNLLPDGERPVIRERVLDWRFEYTTPEEKAQHDALCRAARFISEHAPMFPNVVRAHSTAAAAVLAVKTWPLFMHEKGDRSEDLSPEEKVKRVLEAARSFDRP